MQCLFCTPYSYMYGNTKVIPQVSQGHVTSVLCKLTFSQESRCGVTSNRWDFVWETKYWGLRCFIFHTKSQRLLVTRHRLSREKVNSHNTLVTWPWDACGYTRSLFTLWSCAVSFTSYSQRVRFMSLDQRKNSWSTRSDLIPIALAYNGFQHISAVLLFWNLSEKGPKGRKFLFWAREAPKSHRWRKRKEEKERAKGRKVGDEKKRSVCTLSFYNGYFGEKKHCLTEEVYLALNVFKNPARYIIPYLFLLSVVAKILFLDSYVN